MELESSVENLTYDKLENKINDFKEFLKTSDYPKQIFKKNQKKSIEVLNYTLYFFEQFQKKSPENMNQDTFSQIYLKLVEINNLWKNIH